MRAHVAGLEDGLIGDAHTGAGRLDGQAVRKPALAARGAEAIGRLERDAIAHGSVGAALRRELNVAAAGAHPDETFVERLPRGAPAPGRARGPGCARRPRR